MSTTEDQPTDGSKAVKRIAQKVAAVCRENEQDELAFDYMLDLASQMRIEFISKSGKDGFLTNLESKLDTQPQRAEDLAAVLGTLVRSNGSWSRILDRLSHLRIQLERNSAIRWNADCENVVDSLIDHLEGEMEKMQSAPSLRSRLASYRGDGSLYGWLRMIALRKIRDLPDRNFLSLDERLLAEREKIELSEEQESELQEAIQQLPTEDQLLIVWSFFDGKQSKSIAQHFGISASAISQRKKKALKCLREFLNEKREVSK